MFTETREKPLINNKIKRYIQSFFKKNQKKPKKTLKRAKNVLTSRFAFGILAKRPLCGCSIKTTINPLQGNN